jgi:RecB family exonuclease
LIGRVDRSFGDQTHRVIGDYKTGKVKGLTDATRMLKAQTLQVPLYWMLAGARARVEVLGVGPRHDPDEVDEEARIMTFGGLEKEVLDGFHETMRVLTDLIGDGVFPLKHDNIGCSYCPYELSCRHRHPPTLEREEHAADRADFSDLRHKNKSAKPTLQAVRKGR